MDSPTLSRFPTDLAPPDTFDFRGDAGEFAYQQEHATWQRETEDTLERMSLDPATAFRDIDLSETGDPDYARRLITNTAFMDFLTGSTIPAEEDNLHRHMTRSSIARQVFAGKGAESEDALGEQITAHYQGRRDARELDSAMRQEVWKAALSGEMSEKATDWPTWRTTARALPGFDSKKEPEYLQRWHNYTVEARERMAPYKPQLARVWKAMKSGGGGSPSQLLKEMLPFASLDGNDFVDEFRKEDAGAVAYEVYDHLDEQGRADFLDGVHMLVRTFPKEEQASIFSNLAKAGGRTVDDIGHGIFDRFKMSNFVDALNEDISQKTLESAGPWGATDKEKAEARQTLDETRAKRLLRNNFVDKVREMERGEYAPIRHFSAPSDDLFSMRTLEDGLYAIPSVAAYAGTTLIPYVGAPAMYLTMEDMAYKDLRDNAIRSGASELDASLFADKWKAEAAIPQTAIEVLQSYIPLGKIPAVNRVLTSAGNKIKSGFVRGAVTAVAVNAGETVTEEIQYQIPFAVQELAHAFATDTGIDGAEWYNGKDGALDGIWTRAGVNFIAMGPLSAGSIPGVLGRDQRMRAFAEATHTQRLAFGLTSEDSAAIDAAALRGPSSLAAAVDTALERRDPNSDSARVAVGELERLHESKKEAVRRAQDSGILPRAVQHSDGSFTLYDTDTGKEIAKVSDWESATRVATTHAGMVEERDSDRIAAVASAYQAAQFSGDWSKLTGQQTETRLDFGTRETTTQAASRSEDHRQRVESQELLDGGDGSVTRSVLGESRTTFEEGQARTVNRILDGGSILTIFHEEAHGFRRRAHKNGSLTVADDIAILRAVDTVLAGKTTREGNRQLRLLPENFDTLSPKDQETAIDEAISRLMEAEVLRTRKGGGVRELPAGIISKNLSALSRLAGDKSVGKFRAFVRAVRAHFGLAIDRATEIRRGLEDGTISHKDYYDYLSKLHGLDSRQIQSALADSFSDNRSFSLSPIGTGAKTITGAPPVLPLRNNPFSGETAVTPGEWRAVWSSWMKDNRAKWEGAQPVMLTEGPVSMGAQTRDHLKQTRAGESPAHHFEAAVRMRELLENSVIATIESPRAYEKGASEIHRRYAWMEFSDGVTRHVLLTVKRWGEETAREVDTLYALEALEVREPDALQVESLPFRKDSPSISSDSAATIGRFLSGIKPEHRANFGGVETEVRPPDDTAFSFAESSPERDARSLPVLSIPSTLLPGGNRAEWRKQIRQYIATELQDRTIINKDTNLPIRFNSESKGEAVSKLRREPAFRAAKEIATITEEAVSVGSVPAAKQRTGTTDRFEYFALPVEIDGTRQTAWFNARVMTGGDAVFYEFGLYDKKEAPATQRTDETSESPQSASQPGLASTVGQFLSEIKSTLPAAIKVGEDRSFSLGPAIPRLSEQQSRQVEDLAFENAKRTRIVNTDDIRPLIPGYSEADPLTRDAALHPTASAITTRVLERMLAEAPITGKVLVLAGGGGSGKSTVLDMFSTDADIIFDTTFSYPEYAEKLHSQIVASGRKIEVLYVHRQFGKAFENIIGRFLKGKATGDPRIVPLPVAASAHTGAQDVILHLKGIPIKVFENNRSIDEIREISLGQLADQSYDRQHEPGRDESENRSEETEGSPRKGAQGTGGDSRNYRRARTQARLETEGRAIIEHYRSRGRLTDAEAKAFLGE